MTTSLWKGLIEVLFENCSNHEEIPEKNIAFREKLFLLEKCTNLSQIYGNFTAFFTDETVHYLNSDLLHEINNSIREKSPLATACKRNFVNAVRFYVQRMKDKCINENILYLSSSVEILQILLNKKQEFSKVFPDLFTFSVKLNHLEIVKFLYEKQPVLKRNLIESCVSNNYIEMFEFFYEKGTFKFDTCAYLVTTLEFLRHFESKGMVYKIQNIYNIVEENPKKVKIEVIEYILKNGNSPADQSDLDNIQAFMQDIIRILIENERCDIFEVLLKANFIKIEDERLSSSIHDNYWSLLEFLLKMNYNMKTFSQRTLNVVLLYITLCREKKKFLKFFLNQGIFLGFENFKYFVMYYDTETIIEITSEFPELFIPLLREDLSFVEDPIVLQHFLILSAESS